MADRRMTIIVALLVLAACDGGGGGDASADAGDPSDGAGPNLNDAATPDDGGLPQTELVLLTAGVEGDGAGRLRSEPPGLDCALPCAASFRTGTSVTLVVEPDYRSTFEGFSSGAPGCEGDTCTLVLDGDRSIAVQLDHHAPVRISETDRDPDLRVREDGLAVDFYIHGGARSVQSVAPGSGVFYFEGRRLIDDQVDQGFGVATALAPLLESSVGDDDQSFGILADGSIMYRGAGVGYAGESAVHGIVVDYRSGPPIVHVIALDAGSSRVVHTEVLTTIDTPLHVFVAGSKRVPDYQLEINAGNDVQNLPFSLDPRAALRAASLGAVADALVLGFGDSYAGPPDALPDLSTSADMVVAAGTPVTLTASALDPEEGDLGASIEWDLLSSPHYAGRVRGTGTSFSFTPTAVGLHPARARVRDRTGRVVERIVRVRVPGPVAEQERVVLAPDARSGSGIEIAPSGLAARWTLGGKHGIRANQSLYGEWGYFEIHRLVAPVNQGGGLVISEGNLNPYSWDDVPGSCSINTMSAVWHDLIWRRNYPGEPSDYDTYGFAVDYRGEHPVVYVIAGGELLITLTLDDVWVEIYPMLYGDLTGLTTPGQYDEAIEFGANGFTFDPVAILRAAGVDVTGLVPGWGHANTQNR